MTLVTAFQDIVLGVKGSLIVVAFLFLIWIVGGAMLYIAVKHWFRDTGIKS